MADKVTNGQIVAGLLRNLLEEALRRRDYKMAMTASCALFGCRECIDSIIAIIEGIEEEKECPNPN